MQYKSIELKSCVKGEQINIKFSGCDKIYMALLTPSGYKDYKEDPSKIQREPIRFTPARFNVYCDSDVVLVADLNGQSMRGINVELEGRYAPNIKDLEILTHNTNIGKALVRNAEDTSTDGSMIQHWENNKSEKSTIDLENFICPSCCKKTARNHIHGAHVQMVRGSKWYITPTCDSCNTSKTKRLFRVAECDLVEAPND